MRKVYDGAILNCPIYLILRISPSLLISVEKKPKNQIAETE